MAVPEVSVLIPVRNGERYLAEALDGMLADDTPTREVIIVDDGSSDGTAAILEARAARDRRIVAVRQPPTGVVAAQELARRHAQAPLIARLDADDIAYPGRLARQVAAFRAEPALVLLGSAVDRIDERGTRNGLISYATSHEELVAILPRANAFVHSSIMMRSEAVAAAGGYRSLFSGSEDYDLWLRLAERGRIGNLADRLGAYRVHNQSFSERWRLRQTFSAALARRCAALRRAGQPDPGDARDMVDLDAEPAPDDPLAEDIRLFRALAFAERETFDRRRPTDADAELLLSRSLLHAEKRLAQAALANMIRLKVRPPSLSLPRALGRVLAIDPRRAVRAFRPSKA